MPLSRLAMTEAASRYVVLACPGGWVPPGIGGCGVAAATGAAGALPGAPGNGVPTLDALGMILSVSRRMSFTFCTIVSHSVFCDTKSTWVVAPVEPWPPADPAPTPNCVD